MAYCAGDQSLCASARLSSSESKRRSVAVGTDRRAAHARLRRAKRKCSPDHAADSIFVHSTRPLGCRSDARFSPKGSGPGYSPA
jgi:hypothetical protein